MKQLPIAARIYVGAVIAAGAIFLVVFFPASLRHPAWFVTLLLLSSITSAFKVNLPLARSGSRAVGILAILRRQATLASTVTTIVPGLYRLSASLMGAEARGRVRAWRAAR